MPQPTTSDREAIFGVHIVNKPLAEDVDVSKLAAETGGFAGSDIEAVCRRASMLAISGFLDSGEEDDPSRLTISQGHFMAAVESVRKLHESPPRTPADEIPPA